MKRKYKNKILVTGIVVLFTITNFISASGIKNDKQIQKNVIFSNSFDIIPGIPTKNGTWTLSIYHKGEWNNIVYEGIWTFEVTTHIGMTAEEKAQAMRNAINERQGCPLLTGGTGANVSVSSDNGQIIKYSSKSDDGQSIHGTYPQFTAFCFIGTPSTGSVKVDIGGYIASTTTDGKSLLQIHNDLFTQLQNQGFFVLMDSSGLAFYVVGIYSIVGIDSDDSWLTSMVDFLLDLSVEPFGIYANMQEDIVGSSGSSISVVFDFLNFRCISDTYKITASDELGWEIDPNYEEIGFIAGQKKFRIYDITVPSGTINTTNIVNITITSLTSPWINSVSYIQIVVNNPPSSTIIDGINNGNPQIEYLYNFTSIDPDSDDIFYYIDWGDGNNTGWIGPYSSGQKIIKNHSWSKKGIFVIKAAARDTNGLQGPYGTLTVTIPRSISKNIILNILLDRFSHIFQVFWYLFL
jgi:hypothetical protein